MFGSLSRFCNTFRSITIPTGPQMILGRFYASSTRKCASLVLVQHALFSWTWSVTVSRPNKNNHETIMGFDKPVPGQTSPFNTSTFSPWVNVYSSLRWIHILCEVSSQLDYRNCPSAISLPVVSVAGLLPWGWQVEGDTQHVYKRTKHVCSVGCRSSS